MLVNEPAQSGVIVGEQMHDVLRLDRLTESGEPRKSQNTTVISRLWLSRMWLPPCSRIASASWGERNRRSCPARSTVSTCSATRASSVRFDSASFRRLGLHPRVEGFEVLERLLSWARAIRDPLLERRVALM